jgi:SAM-dependent methyltransferase
VPARPARASPARLSAARVRALRRSWEVQQAAGVDAREERFEFLLAALGAGVGHRFRFLDVGAGTGSLSQRILRQFPRSRGVAVDFDPVVLELGRRGLSESGRRLRWVETDLRRPGWARALPKGRFDAVVSSTALHWFVPSQLGRLYRDLARVTRPGGLFLNADSLGFAESAPRVARIARRVRDVRSDRPARARSWDAWWSAIEREPGLRTEWQERVHRFPHSHMGTRTPDLEGHLRRLRAAGYREAGVIWSHGNNRLLAAVR